tara:strand:+ start:837 stop:1217 length:381 start_codon:yes stop_codon:yes gene_type:complete
MSTDKYITLKPSSLKDYKIDTINVPKFKTLGNKLKKIITEKSRKNKTTLAYEYKKWWVPKGENLVKKIKQEKSTSVKSKKYRKLTPSERTWKTRTEKLEKYLNSLSSGKTKRKKRNHKKRKSIRKK